MSEPTFEQVLKAVPAQGSFTPAWKKFVKTKFFVQVQRSGGDDPRAFSLHLGRDAENGAASILISELRERLDLGAGNATAALYGADIVKRLGADAAILVALSEGAFRIAADRVAWLKAGVEAAQARAAAAAPAAAAAAPVTPAAPAAAPAAPPVNLSKAEPAAPAPVRVRPRAEPDATQENAEYEDTVEAPPLFGFSTAGRLGRLRALAYSLVSILPGLAIGGLMLLLGQPENWLIVGLFGICMLSTTFLGLRALAMRLHDMDASGKWVVVLMLLGMASRRAPEHALAFEGLAAIMTLVLFATPGSRGGNTYGLATEPDSPFIKRAAVLSMLLHALAYGALLYMAPKPPPRPEAETMHRFSPPKEGVSVLLPRAPQKLPVDMAEQAALGHVTLHQYSLVEGLRRYSVRIYNHKSTPLVPSNAAATMEELVVAGGTKIGERAGGTGYGWGRILYVRQPGGNIRGAHIMSNGPFVVAISVEAPDTPADLKHIDVVLDSMVAR